MRQLWRILDMLLSMNDTGHEATNNVYENNGVSIPSYRLCDILHLYPRQGKGLRVGTFLLDKAKLRVLVLPYISNAKAECERQRLLQHPVSSEIARFRSQDDCMLAKYSSTIS